MAIHPHLHKLHNYTSPKFWRGLVNVWTIFLFGAVIWDFVYNNNLSGVLGPIAAIYTAALAIYSAEKEFERWYDYYDGRHPGELYIFAWTILIMGILLIDVLLGKLYKLPHEIVSTYIVVIGILAITKNSKRVHSEKKRKTKSKTGRRVEKR